MMVVMIVMAVMVMIVGVMAGMTCVKRLLALDINQYSTLHVSMIC